MEKKRGKQKDPYNEIAWAPPKKYYVPKPDLYLSTYEKIKRDRVIKGYEQLFTLVFDRKPNSTELKKIKNISNQLGF